MSVKNYTHIFNRTLYMFFFIINRRPPRSTLVRSSAASDVYKRQLLDQPQAHRLRIEVVIAARVGRDGGEVMDSRQLHGFKPVFYTHLRTHESGLDIVFRLLLADQNFHSLLPDFHLHHRRARWVHLLTY